MIVIKRYDKRGQWVPVAVNAMPSSTWHATPDVLGTPEDAILPVHVQVQAMAPVLCTYLRCVLTLSDSAQM